MVTSRTALVYGAAQGIGHACARMLCKRGYRVMLADINAEKVAAAADQLAKEGYAAASCPVNVDNLQEIEHASNAAYEKFGSLDVVVHCVGILYTTSVEETTPEQWDKVMSVNLRSAFFAAQKALPYLKKASVPRIIYIASIAGLMGGFNVSMSYSASKGGMIALAKGLSRQLAPYGITVNSVCPSTVNGDMAKAYTPEVMELQKSRSFLNRIAEPEEIAAAVCFLASEETSFITGATIDINGGTYIR